ncbi:hypothetical protein [Microbulbifer agarilyticus]|uniref:hypothetical protein n=1 Tax=Microbulbifer agarilyticus TaxID=260552 RepID=UPI001CD36FDD|nr:hypothetical protein [Microbulbifer agarilyticus]MCA0902219.1 hypothetical protein [Microbulbifer agarilyticus]
MRLILALIYIATGGWLYITLVGDSLPPIVGVIFALALMLSSVIVCNEGFLRRLKGQSEDDHINQLIGERAAVVESFKVHDAITFEDLSTGCLCHLLNIGDNRVACLYGQYLYEYSEITDDPELNQNRMFPTTDFTWVRHLKNNTIIRLEIGKSVCEEVKLENPSIDNLFKLGLQLKDGEVVEGVEFGRLRAACGN